MAEPRSSRRFYAVTLRKIEESLRSIDWCISAFGPDGHTASLVPGDPAWMSTTRSGVTARIRAGAGWTLTYRFSIAPARFWVVNGDGKAEMVNRLLDGDRAIPAGRVRSDRALLLADYAAAPGLRNKERGVICV